VHLSDHFRRRPPATVDGAQRPSAPLAGCNTLRGSRPPPGCDTLGPLQPGCIPVASGLHPPPYRPPPGCDTFKRSGRNRGTLCASGIDRRPRLVRTPAANSSKNRRQTPPVLLPDVCKSCSPFRCKRAPSSALQATVLGRPAPPQRRRLKAARRPRPGKAGHPCSATACRSWYRARRYWGCPLTSRANIGRQQT
jgi:hypothetical protein